MNVMLFPPAVALQKSDVYGRRSMRWNLFPFDRHEMGSRVFVMMHLHSAKRRPLAGECTSRIRFFDERVVTR